MTPLLMLNKQLVKKIEQVNEAKFDATSPVDRAMLFLAGTISGGRTSAVKIASITGLERNECNAFKARAVKNRIFRGNKIAAEWFDEKAGDYAFILDALVLVGIVEKGWDE